MRIRRATAAALPGVLRVPAHADSRDIGRETPAADAGRTPTLHGKIDSAGAADRAVAHGAGAGRTP
ncbi:hypothetical protein ACFY30_20650 [Streptomyces sp. NPDC000345]|uniref:hypothetical protein n=1 Tax=Streptomyces sp. NPDC000345 TaxID=3364537 RepID=UPI0036BE233C